MVDTKTSGIVFKPLDIPTLCMEVISDASFCNLKGYRRQHGYIIVVADKMGHQILSTMLEITVKEILDIFWLPRRTIWFYLLIGPTLCYQRQDKRNNGYTNRSRCVHGL